MPITYHIGRLHPETLPIPERHAGVSREHCRITIQDNGEWYLEDTNSTQGTYVVNPDGSLTRVSCMRISPTTKIQLGQADVSGFTFIAAVVNKDYRSAWRLPSAMPSLPSCAPSSRASKPTRPPSRSA